MSMNVISEICELLWKLPAQTQKALTRYAAGNNEILHDVLYHYTSRKLCNIYGISSKSAATIIHARKDGKQV